MGETATIPQAVAPEEPHRMDKLPWHNNFPRNAAEIARIVAADLPQLVPVSAAPLGEGWDYSTFLVNEHWVFRFPKRNQSARALKREMATLESIADLAATLPIPRYEYRVDRSSAFPTAYGGYAYIAGTPLLDAEGVDARLIGKELGPFLARLHATPTVSQRNARVRDDLIDWIPDFQRELTEAAPGMPPHIHAACAALLERPPPAFDGETAFTHADLGAEHILIGDGGTRISGVIDWGDAGMGDPLADYVGLWAWGGDRAAEACFDASGLTLTPARWARLRFWGVCYAIGSTYYGYKGGQATLHHAALSWLQRMYANGQLEDSSNQDG